MWKYAEDKAPEKEPGEVRKWLDSVYEKLKNTGKSAYNSYMSALKGDEVDDLKDYVKETKRYAKSGKSTGKKEHEKAKRALNRARLKTWGARLGTGAVAGGAALYGGKKLYDAISGD